MVGLGGLSITGPTTTTPTFSNFTAEQRIMEATIYTRANTGTGSTLETLTYIHPEENQLVTDLTYTAVGGDPATLNLGVTVWAYTNGKMASAGTESSGVMHATRHASKNSSIPALQAAGLRSIQTAIAVRVVSPPLNPTANTPSTTDDAALRTNPAPPPSVGTPQHDNPKSQTVTTTGKLTVHSGSGSNPTSIVVVVADNLLEGNAHDPVAEATASVATVTPAAVKSAAAGAMLCCCQHFCVVGDGWGWGDHCSI
jgi:hypothetical protein